MTGTAAIETRSRRAARRRIGPLCGPERESCSRCVSRIAVLAARSAAEDTGNQSRAIGYQEAEPLGWLPPSAYHGGNDVEDVVDHEVGVAVEQHQVTVDESVLEALGQRVEIGE